MNLLDELETNILSDLARENRATHYVDDHCFNRGLDKAAEIVKELVGQMRDTPVDMILFCPKCRLQHVDKADPDKCQDCGHAVTDHYADDRAPEQTGICMANPVCACKKFNPWLNPVHKKHRCQNPACNEVFKPANIPTNGVEELPQ
jgi:hypothetical protein